MSSRASGQELNQSVKLLASDGAALDYFGASVSASGDVTVVGAWGNNTGAAYVFRWNGSSWVQEQLLFSIDGSHDFGIAVSVFGDVAVAGASGDNDIAPASGAAYVFRWNGSSWVEDQKLLASDGAEQDRFGNSVSVFGDVIIVGARRDDNPDFDSGSAYVFRWNGSSWIEEQKLSASDGAKSDWFGTSVSVSGDVAIVGAMWDDDNGTDSGSAYVFRWNGSSWIQAPKLLPADGAGDDEFGGSVSASGNVVLVGAKQDDDNSFESGSAYFFRWTGSSWMQEQKILASDGLWGDWFGYSVSVSGGVAVVGAVFSEDNGSNSGSAYVFRWTGSSWAQEHKMLPSDGAADDNFGEAVAVSGDLAIVGAHFDGDSGSQSGSAYVFNLACDPGYYGPVCLECPGGAGNPCNANGACDDGVDGSGSCICSFPYTGSACTQCLPEYYDYPNCVFCSAPTTCSGHGNCNSLGNCVCQSGWTGPNCATSVETDIPTVSEWGMTVMTLLILTAGTLIYIRRRQATA